MNKNGLVLVASRYSAGLSFALIPLVGAGSYGTLGPFWAIPTALAAFLIHGFRLLRLDASLAAMVARSHEGVRR